ncbi:hypothetical protein K438DRAFT_1995679 [Mycena galopus ATCC 62051]|nr:hypothetical protein K438DRAFT_1995679 [Mycena galopus ATCC 62051]
MPCWAGIGLIPSRRNPKTWPCSSSLAVAYPLAALGDAAPEEEEDERGDDVRGIGSQSAHSGILDTAAMSANDDPPSYYSLIHPPDYSITSSPPGIPPQYTFMDGIPDPRRSLFTRIVISIGRFFCPAPPRAPEAFEMTRSSSKTAMVLTEEDRRPINVVCREA